jgi:HK97 gp10 family phage protein
MPSYKATARAEAAGVRAQLDFDAAAFMADLALKLKALEVTTTAALWGLALEVQNLARALAAVDTGRLRSSIQATKGSDGNGPFVDIGTNVEYAIYVEFGTRYMVAQPYLRPALAMAAARWSSIARSSA